ncbi:beta-ketoacyl-[acyl-carrier-protein] synthase family protein [Algoriphagus sp. D3-2-R+10]|uniref:beta-ketoacyl-[acyl-carrier-protein] synthase family protein n=1 Tax=Algoriphagus aurantiacus TaxID=3103948 RepID=UPI002B38AABA|nr:beta-ketoacyl-[acyl-carrier-protein] synthase family protein [Algoriphagus sp. D3-2-R+10]MEB2777807.1 beta-ketoacyl-[acyl-carrier-protein] synthase family protein [Algoriphagus sp. D3-2-R+10]
MTKINVTGLGVVSALGISSKHHFNQLRSGIIGISHYQRDGQYFYAGKVPFTNQQLSKLGGVPLSDYTSRSALLGLLAANEAMGSTVFDSGMPTAFINGTTVGGMDLSEQYFEAKSKGEQGDAALFQMHDLGANSTYIAENVGDFEYVNTISTACSSAANAIMLGAQLIHTGEFHRVLVGGTDALCNFTIEGFRSLMVYDTHLCQPFDASRRGLNLGEGAGYLLLESDQSIKESGNRCLAKLSGWANRNDAFHNTGTSPEGIGAQKAMRAALEIAGLKPDQISYINAHGTGTQNNDSSELAAMESVFGDVLPDFSSTKGATGHTLAASGAIEAIFAVQSLLENCAFGNFSIVEPMTDSSSLLRKAVPKDIHHVMSNSFGFGGNSTSLIFSKN